ncbi:MAG TPA: mersacidin/lichenicidin family type 2 lantibiotic [Waterburya sp.]|jgi:mersacidin/lichenicidin family type 2 lantibiotic
MSHEDIIRAWKDPEYRMSLSEEKRAQLPENPAGLIELTDGEMGLVGGGYGDDGGDGGNEDPGLFGTYFTCPLRSLTIYDCPTEVAGGCRKPNLPRSPF